MVRRSTGRTLWHDSAVGRSAGLMMVIGPVSRGWVRIPSAPRFSLVVGFFSCVRSGARAAFLLAGGCDPSRGHGSPDPAGQSRPGLRQVSCSLSSPVVRIDLNDSKPMPGRLSGILPISLSVLDFNEHRPSYSFPVCLMPTSTSRPYPLPCA